MAMLPFPMPMAALASTGGSGFVIIAAVGSGSWAVPAGFDPTNNVIELIGAGGNGASQSGGNGCKGGGGGQYAKLLNLSLTPGASIPYQVGIGGGSVGTSAAPGSADSWFNSASSTIYAQGGTTGVSSGTGPPGGSAAAVGSSTVANGGGGGNGGGLVSQGSGGGGGAGGPHGAGGGGTNNTGGTSGVNGGSGDAGNAAGGAATAGAGGNGSAESYWNPGIGPAGGGASGNTSVACNGGSGASIGGGGGGGGSGGAGGGGGNGILVIRWGDFASNVTAPPIFVQAPVINSSAAPFCGVGDTLTATPGITAGYVNSTSFQWYADGVAIAGATGLSYTLTSAELGKVVTITEVATNSLGSASASASAIRFGPVVNPAFATDQRITTAADIRITTASDTRVTTTRIA